ncbi:MAG: membrane protein insertase YidC [Pyrinomonadaceae bacterium]
MVDQQDKQGQSRFLIAALLSMVVLFAWSYFFAPTKPPENSNTAATAANTAETLPAQAPAQPAPVPQAPASAPDNIPARTVRIKSPLYDVTLDSKGAVATSWILLRNRTPKGDSPIYADGSNGNEQKPLQLISQKALEQEPREVPFRLFFADQNLTTLANGRNYQISAAENEIELGEGDEREIVFTLTDPNGVEIKKAFVFRGNSYVADLAVTAIQNGQSLPNAKLALGASIGDHAINHHGFYHIESETVAIVDGEIKRHQGYYSFTYDANNQASLADQGSVDWAGVGDAYFAMAAIPASPQQNIEYRAYKYDVETQPFFPSIWRWAIRSPETKETRHLVTAFVPVTTDGSATKVYTGTKDYFLLSELSGDSLFSEPNGNLKGADGRAVSLVDLINFSNYRPIRFFVKPLSIPILHALNFFNTIAANYGVAIIIFTFLFYSLLFPLRWKQSKSFKKASSNAPKMQELQKKIKDMQAKGVPTDDPRMRELQMQQLRLTKDALPIGGCLPMLLQFPLLFAFYTAITIALDARQASFMWIPDLSGADPWHLLEFGFAISMVLAMKFTPTTAAVTPEQQMQQKMMTWLMPVMMLWVMWTAPAGLLLYWFFGNIVSFGQQMLINRLNKTNEPPAAEVVESVPKSAKKVKPKLSTS